MFAKQNLTMTKKIEKNIIFTVAETPSELSENDFNLFKKAKSIAAKAYAPYSEFKVGCAIELISGEIILSSNQENAAYPSGLCAERVGLFYAGANYPDDEIKTIFIYAVGEMLQKEDFLSPCGACRQVMAETQSRQKNTFRILLCGNDEQVLIVEKVEDILPFMFGKK